jgi:hydrogenase-4 component B
MTFGAVSGVLGVAFALGQHDLKRLLAYHSIENIGIIVLGVGLGFAGVALRRPAWAVLGFGGGLLHVVNHALFKALLFLGAGSVIHATGTREMDRMGGLLKHLPRTAGTFLVGSVAICGLPPLNGFVSEWLLYLGLLGPASERGPLATGAAGAAAALALIGGLALACFVKAFGAVFLGVPRKAAPQRPHEAAGMVAPMLILAALCAVIGLVPLVAAPLVDGAVGVAGGPVGIGAAGGVSAAAPLAVLGFVQLGIAATVAIVAGALAWRLHRQGIVRGVPTWDCGYAAPTPRMQYTASSFAAWSVGHFRWALHPESSTPGLDRPFPREARFGSHVPDTVLDRLILPVVHGSARLVAASRVLQRGRMQLYLVYVAVALVLLLWRV